MSMNNKQFHPNDPNHPSFNLAMQQQQSNTTSKPQINQDDSIRVRIEFKTTAPAQRSLQNGYEVLKAINTIRKSILSMGGIQKTRENETMHYMYASFEDFNNAISPLLAEHDLLFFGSIESSSVSEYLTKKKDIMFKAVVHVRYTWFSVKDGSFFESIVVGEANDSTDKASQKALTIALKSLFRQTFSIEASDDQPQAENNNQSKTKQQNQNQYNRTQHNTAQVYNHANSKLASLEFKNEVDEFMKPHNNRLIEVLKKRNIDINTITHVQLEQIFSQFKDFIQKGS